MNHIPVKYNDKLVSSFILVHGAHADCCGWHPLRLICYFHHIAKGSTKRPKNQVQTMDGIIVGCCPDSNTAPVYSPRNKNFYQPVSCPIDPHRMPSSVYSNTTYNMGYSMPSAGATSPALRSFLLSFTWTPCAN